MPVVRITSPKPFVYSLDGRTKSRFQPDELYQVPEHVARGMIRRGWAKDAREEAELVQEPSQGTLPEEDLEGTGTGEDQADDGDDDEGGDDDVSGEGDAPSETGQPEKRQTRRKRKSRKGS